MPQVSRRHVNPEVEKRIANLFEDYIRNIGKYPKSTPFISELFTDTEKKMLSKRIAIAFLLIKGGSDIRSIANLLKVSTATVNRINNIIKTGGEGFQQIVTKLLMQENFKDLLHKISFYLISFSEREAWRKTLGLYKPPKRSSRYLH